MDQVRHLQRAPASLGNPLLPFREILEDQTQPGFTHFGSFAEYVAIDNADFNLITIPTEVSFATAAALGCRFATSYRGLIKRAKVGKAWLGLSWANLSITT